MAIQAPNVGGRGKTTLDDVVFGVLPLNHIMGLTVVALLTLQVGASAVLVQRFDPVTAHSPLRGNRESVR